MPRPSLTMLLLWLALNAASTVRADDQAAAKAIVEKAIKAHGGEERLSKIKAATWKDKGKYFGMGAEGVEYTAEVEAAGTTKRKVTVEGEFGGEKFSLIYVVNGDQGWTKTDDEVEDMDKENLDEQKEQQFADWTAFVNPVALKTDAFKLAPLGETKVEDRTLVGVRASAKGRRDINLYFDKETGLLHKTEWQIKDLEGEAGGGEIQQEVIVGEHKEFNGVKIATKTVVKWAGKPHIESELSDFQLVDKLDDETFRKP